MIFLEMESPGLAGTKPGQGQRLANVNVARPETHGKPPCAEAQVSSSFSPRGFSAPSIDGLSKTSQPVGTRP